MGVPYRCCSTVVGGGWPMTVTGLARQFNQERLSQTLKPFLWMHCSTMVQGRRTTDLAHASDL